MALFKRKDKDGKRKGENAIGKIIYGFLLFMPLIAVLTACLYVIINKNAYQSYSGEIIAESTTYLNTTNNTLPTGSLVKYYCNGETNTYTTSYSGWFTYDEISIDNVNPIMVRFRYRYSNQDLQFNNGSNQYEYFPVQSFNFTLKEYEYTDTGTTYLTNFYYITYIALNTLDNVFYQELNKLEESDLFNWSKNTGAYTIMHNVTDGIGITNTYTPMLMTYWLLISVIYFIFDIALILVWAVHDKIHELKDAI